MIALLQTVPGWAVAHAPALLIVVPLILAPIMALMPNGRFAWIAAMAAAAVSFFFALILYALVLDSPSGILSYALGRWAVPLGIEFRIDALNAFVLLVVTFVSALVMVFSWPSVEAEFRREKHAMIYCMMTLASLGFSGVAITGDAFNLFVFLEICSLSAYVLVALGERRDRRALPAAFNYLVMGTIGASFYVTGLGFLYAATGSLNMAELAKQLPALMDRRSVQAGFAFIVAGLGMKAAMWPLHQWLPNAYAYAPSVVRVLLAATATKVSVYALVRFVFAIFDPGVAFAEAILANLIMPLAVVAIVACSMQAVFQTDVRRILAYSSVAQTGYILLSISAATAAGISAGIFHLGAHALMKACLFMCVASVVLQFETASVKDFSGLARTAPWTAMAFAIAGASLIGLPLTVGFQTKLQLGYALFDRGWYAGLAAIIAGTLLAVLYIGKVIAAMFFDAPSNPNKVRKEAPYLMLVPMWILALANIYFGIAAGWPQGFALAGARAVLGAGGVS